MLIAIIEEIDTQLVSNLENLPLWVFQLPVLSVHTTKTRKQIEHMISVDVDLNWGCVY